MSRESLTWLNTNTLIGFTDKRGRAWHYRADEQSNEPNHYPGAIPVADVRRRLFNWHAVEGQISATALTPDGVLTSMPCPDRKAVMRSDTGLILGIFKDGYKPHQYDEWLLDNVSTLLDGDLSIGSAGLLKQGAVAWVSIEVPESITTPEGVTFRPHLLGTTSFDGSIATTFKRVVQLAVCDNTLSVALGEKGQTVKVKHSRNSMVKLSDAREALNLVYTIADEFTAKVAHLCNVTVTDRQWQRFLDSIAPISPDTGRSRTMAVNKQDTLSRLYNHDTRVAPWRGTAFGVVQAMNTFTHHEGIVRGADRAERNMLRAVTGGVDDLDASTLESLQAVLA